jgi:hypothetical protein
LANSFGDTQFLYRSLAMDLQNFGDTGGHLTPLKDYDVRQLVAWMRVLDSLDALANHHVTLAARYFSQTQHKADVEQLVRYVQEHVAKNPREKVQWLGDAISLAAVRLGNNALAMEVADQLATYDFPEMTVIAYQLPALIHRRAGDYAGAARLMAQAYERVKTRSSPQDLEFMEGFIAQMQQQAEGPTAGPPGHKP